MEAVTAINDRILQIQSRIATLTAPRSAAGPVAPMSVLGTGAALTGGPPSGPTFDAVLAQALGEPTATPPVATPASDAVGSGRSRVNGKGVPVELLPHGNGQVPGSALSGIAGTNHSLWAPAARSFEALRDAATREGITIGITDSYRPYETQVDLARRKGLYSEGGLAARPGTSDHGWGIALDLRLDAAAQAWMRTNAGRFGFVEDVPREPWHWSYRPTH